jgi:hypothetical protein
MSTPRTKPHALASLFQSTQREQGYMSDYAATHTQVGSVQTPKSADPAPAAKPSAPPKTSKGWGGVVASPATRAWRCVMRAISKPSPKLAPPSDLDQWPLPSDSKTAKESKPRPLLRCILVFPRNPVFQPSSSGRQNANSQQPGMQPTRLSSKSCWRTPASWWLPFLSRSNSTKTRC